MKNILKVTCVAAGIAIFVVGTFVVLTVKDLKARSAVIRKDAIETYGGDEVMALVSFVDDRSRSAKDRNYVIGMLANLSDSRALPVLEKYYTGYDEDEGIRGYCCSAFTLCQYELKKAVTRSREDSGMNILTMVLR
jgi:hypothetical protein